MKFFDCFALTADYAGFGLILLEAMAAGRPVVATAVSAIPEVVIDGETGLLCTAGDAEAVAVAFARLEDDLCMFNWGKRASDVSPTTLP
jgi:glycosyltransferase involved in cell wall biosynthesis